MVRFFVSEDSPTALTVTHEQARALLYALGADDDEVPPVPHHGPLEGKPFRGSITADWLRDRLTAARRQFTSGRASEFTSTELSKDAIVQCVIALEALSHEATVGGQNAVFFREMT